MINVIERKVEGKHNMETCEDAIVLTPHFVWLLLMVVPAKQPSVITMELVMDEWQ